MSTCASRLVSVKTRDFHDKQKYYTEKKNYLAIYKRKKRHFAKKNGNKKTHFIVSSFEMCQIMLVTVINHPPKYYLGKNLA